MKPALSALLLAALALPTSGLAAGLRCGNRLVSDDATRGEVRGVCGEPIHVTVREEVERHVSDSGDERVVVHVYEEWTYNFGPNSLLQTVFFRNGLLVDVRSGKRGY